MYNCILIGIDEIWTKSKKIKKKMINILIDDIKNRINFDKIENKRGRIIIWNYKDDWINILRNIPGIKNIYPAIYLETSIENIKKYSSEFLSNFVGNINRFKISTKRIDKNFPYKSIEVNKIIGEEILNKYKLKVDVKDPEKILYIEIHQDYTFIYDRIIKGPGGLPEGSEGRGILLFSGGSDSSISSYIISKRGLKIDFLFINIAGDIYLHYIYNVYNKLKEYFPNSKLYVYDLDIGYLFNVKEGYKQILFKVIIYKIAEKFAKKNNYDCIVTGESLGQFSSQSIDSLKILDSLVYILVLRPLIGFNKSEILDISKKIGIYDIRAPDICKIENHPVTKPKIDIVISELNKLNIDFDKEVEKIREVNNINIEEFNLKIPDKKDLIIVRFEEFSKYNFEKGNKYLLICEKGILSRYFAKRLRDRGIEAYYMDEKTAKILGYI
ncbi:MAG: THUMP domain-containing protein [Candidatus Nanopusillus sp.]